MRIAYFTNQYPKASHSFIRREIMAHEAAGVAGERGIMRVSVRRTREELADEGDRRELEKTRVLLDAGVLGLAGAGCWMMLTHPVRFLRALRGAYALSRESARSIGVHFMYLLEACLLRRWLAKDQVEHMHVHFGTNPAAVAMLCRMLGGPTYSVTVHGPDEFDAAAGLGLDQKARWASAIVGISSYGCSQLARWVDREDQGKICTVHCGLDETFLAGALSAVPERNRLVFVGRLTATKGIYVLVEAMRMLRCRGVAAELAVIGDGPERAAMEALIEKYELTAGMRMVGWASGEAVREAIVNSRALVLPSFAEGLPVVLMESLALGRPVITTWVAGIPELVEEGVNGWLVPPGSVEALAEAMEIALRMPVERLTHMGLAGRAKVLRNHNAATEAGKLAELFRKAIEGGEHRRDADATAIEGAA